MTGDKPGKIWKFGDDVDTDLIIPARYLNVSDGKELAAHCFADVRPEFSREATVGDILVAGKNFGCGSSREHAPLALKASGIKVIIAESFARIFYRNSFNIGFPLLESSEAARALTAADRVTVDIATGEIKRESDGAVFSTHPIPAFMRELVDAGGLVPYLRKKRGGT
ncbi:MAG: 3-isopropylmalate dehydratase small subunit [Deltaproteobacteria bacterium]|nr:3-isopropylmalate dehydratase small subunit [Deltaproteobacteria bacterium]